MELVLERGERVVSKTDVNGFITYVNSEFVKYSEYQESELTASPIFDQKTKKIKGYISI